MSVVWVFVKHPGESAPIAYGPYSPAAANRREEALRRNLPDAEIWQQVA